MKEAQVGQDEPPFRQARPILYWAQSKEDVHVSVRLHTFGWDNETVGSQELSQSVLRAALDSSLCI